MLQILCVIHNMGVANTAQTNKKNPQDNQNSRHFQNLEILSCRCLLLPHGSRRPSCSRALEQHMLPNITVTICYSREYFNHPNVKSVFWITTPATCSCWGPAWKERNQLVFQDLIILYYNLGQLMTERCTRFIKQCIPWTLNQSCKYQSW